MRLSSEDHPRTRDTVSDATTRFDRIARTACASPAPGRYAVTAFRWWLRCIWTDGGGGLGHDLPETSFAHSATNRVRYNISGEPRQCHLPTINSGRVAASPARDAIVLLCSTSRVHASDDLHIFPKKYAESMPNNNQYVSSHLPISCERRSKCMRPRTRPAAWRRRRSSRSQSWFRSARRWRCGVPDLADERVYR